MGITKPNFERITESDLTELRESQIAEGLLIEYKRDAYGRSDDGKREILKDVSSFANTAGGHIVIGMAETGGLPTDLVGLDIDFDAEVQRLENLFRDCLEPRIIGLRMRPVPLANGRCALIIRVPKSWNPPHAVSFKGSRRYYARNSGGVHETSVEELRAMFTASATTSERIREFHRHRVTKIHEGDTPVQLGEPGHIILHIVPFSAFGAGASLDPRRMSGLALPPIWRYDFRGTYNFDGYLTTSVERGRGYVQVFRNGIIESAAGLAQVLPDVLSRVEFRTCWRQ